MPKITFRNSVIVHLDGKVVGLISEIVKGDGFVYRYYPKSSPDTPGDEYPTLDACKRSLLS